LCGCKKNIPFFVPFKKSIASRHYVFFNAETIYKNTMPFILKRQKNKAMTTSGFVFLIIYY